MQQLQVYPRGTVLFQQELSDGTIVTMPPCPYDVSVHWDKPRPAVHINKPREASPPSTGPPLHVSAADALHDEHVLDMLLTGTVGGSRANVQLSDGKLLIDTGATGAFMSTACAARPGLRVATSPGAANYITLADGTNVLSPTVLMQRATVQLDAFACKTQFMIAPLASHYDVIVARQLMPLRQHRAILITHWHRDTLPLQR